MILLADDLSEAAAYYTAPERCALRFPDRPPQFRRVQSVRTRTYVLTDRICRSNGIPCMSPPHPISLSKFQPPRRNSIPASVRLLKCPFRGGFKDSGSSTDGATRKVCAIHSLQRFVNILGKSISTPPRILLSKDLLLLSTRIGQCHTGPSSAKTACSNSHLEAGLGTLPREINCFSGLPRFDR